jgi:hypothetical protein
MLQLFLIDLRTPGGAGGYKFILESAALKFDVGLVAIRTGRRNGEHSAKRAALKTTAHAPWQKAARLDFRPRGQARHIAGDGEMRVVGTGELLVATFV